MSGSAFFPPREIVWQVAVAPNPRRWRLLPRLRGLTVLELQYLAGDGAPFHAGHSFTWLFVHVVRAWRYV